MAAAWPTGLRTILAEGKSRSTPAAFRLEQPRRGLGYASKVGTLMPIFWDVRLRFTQAEAVTFWAWYTGTIAYGESTFDLPIRTEFGTITTEVQFLPDSLLPVREQGEVWEYTATIMARRWPDYWYEPFPTSSLSAYSTVRGNSALFTTTATDYGYSLAIASQNAGTVAAIKRSMGRDVTLRTWSFIFQISSLTSDDAATIQLQLGASVFVGAFVPRRESAIDALRRPHFFWGATTLIMGSASLAVSTWYKFLFTINPGSGASTAVVTRVSDGAVITSGNVSGSLSNATVDTLEFHADSGGATGAMLYDEITITN